jgi:hypothetical protein
MIGNLLLIMGIPYWSNLNISIVLWNGGFILNRIGYDIKKFLLLLNNNWL